MFFQCIRRRLLDRDSTNNDNPWLQIKHAVLADPVNAEAVKLSMCACGVKINNFELWSDSSIVRHYHILKAPRLVLNQTLDRDRTACKVQ